MDKNDLLQGKTLSEIAKWIKSDSEVQLPALQRGLVWKPRQVELLWDSILRGFPVGSFVLSEEPDNKYYLMDGQQRFNAIALGYNTIDSREPSTVIWIDIASEQIMQSTRKFWIKVTTLAHPWGYKNDDDCNVLSASEREAALEKYGIKDIYNQKPNLRKTYPYLAKKPLPLHYLLAASTESKEKFIEDVKRYVVTNEGNYEYIASINKELCDLSVEYDKHLGELYNAFVELRKYKIGFSILQRNIIEKEDEQNDNEQTSLEVLFTRLNTGGTRISQDDLIYSAIKAYWPDIKDKNDEIASRYMPPSRLAMLVFRLVLSAHAPEYKTKKRMCGELNIRKIRELRSDKDISKAVIKCYGILDHITDQIETWFGISNQDGDGMPRVIRTSIATNSADVYLLLMWLAYEQANLPSNFVQGLTLYLHWFADDKRKCVNLIFKGCLEHGISESCIRAAMEDSVLHEYLIRLYSPEELKSLFVIKEEKDWRIWSEDYHPWANFFNRIAWQGNQNTREMLLYAQRRYINTHFQAYDPARQDLWADQNRPWDFDHIIPRDWIVGIRGEFREYCKQWLNNIGNVAAIPFSINRSKSNTANFGYYDSNREGLLYTPIDGVTANVAKDKTQAFVFAKSTFDRCCRIYKECYSVIAPLFKVPLPEDSEVAIRRELCKKVQQRYKDLGCRIFYVAGDKEYEMTNEADWARPWVSVGIPLEDKCMVSFTSFRPNDNGDTIHEIGIRRYPGTTVLIKGFQLSDIDPDVEGYSSFMSGWWYLYKNIDGQDVDLIYVEMEKLLKKVRKE